MGFSVELRQGTRLISTSLALAPSFYSANAVGGHQRAEIRVFGNTPAIWEILGWLDYYVTIRNTNGTIVWEGYVVSSTITRPSITVGLSLEKMANRVQVVYNYAKPDGSEEQETTEWLEDTFSVNLYGVKEKQISVSDTTPEVAEAKRYTALNALKNPMPIITFEGGDPGGTLVCVGLWQTLDWFYYSNSVGKEVYDVAKDTEHGLGWGIATNLVGFHDSGIHDLDARLHAFPNDNQVYVQGTFDLVNDGKYTIQSVPDKDKDVKVTYVASTITFEINDDLRDSALGLGFARNGEMVKVSGSTQAANNNYRWVKTTGNDRIEISPDVLVNSTSVVPITVEQGHHLKTQEGFTFQRPGSNLSLASVGTMLAQKFTNTSAVSWVAKEISLYCSRYGDPIDYLQVSIYSSSGTAPLASLSTTTLTALEISTNTDWVSFVLTTGVTLVPGTEYWIVVQRTGAVSYEHYWNVGLETGTLDAMELKMMDTAGWVTRTPVDARMPYQVWSRKETTQIIKAILTANSKIAAISVAVNSGVEEREWRAGDQRALDEIEKLIESGTVTGKRLLAKTIPGRAIIIYEEPTPSMLDLIYTANGRVRRPTTDTWEEGVLPVGEYVRLEDVPIMNNVAYGLSTVLIQEAEYDVESGELRLTPWAMDEDLEY